MKTILAILSVVAIVQCQFTVPDEFRNAKSINEHPKMQSFYSEHFPQDETVGKTPFIVGGANAALGQFPHQALMYITVSASAIYICGGSLINQKWIVTVSHHQRETYQSAKISYQFL
jgi:hypothetical protein